MRWLRACLNSLARAPPTRSVTDERGLVRFDPSLARLEALIQSWIRLDLCLDRHAGGDANGRSGRTRSIHGTHAPLLPCARLCQRLRLGDLRRCSLRAAAKASAGAS